MSNTLLILFNVTFCNYTAINMNFLLHKHLAYQYISDTTHYAYLNFHRNEPHNVVVVEFGKHLEFPLEERAYVTGHIEGFDRHQVAGPLQQNNYVSMTKVMKWINGVDGHDSALVRLHQAGDNLG